MKIPTILVICTGNSCRSQMAEGYLKFFQKKMNLKINIYSAGVRAKGVNTKAIAVMANDNIDISMQTSNKINDYLNDNISHVITVCDHANENCPIFPKKTHFTHKNIKDPSKVIGDNNIIQKAFYDCREEIKYFTEKYLNNNF